MQELYASTRYPLQPDATPMHTLYEVLMRNVLEIVEVAT